MAVQQFRSGLGQSDEARPVYWPALRLALFFCEMAHFLLYGFARSDSNGNAVCCLSTKFTLLAVDIPHVLLGLRVLSSTPTLMGILRTNAG